MPTRRPRRGRPASRQRRPSYSGPRKGTPRRPETLGRLFDRFFRKQGRKR